MRRDHMGVGEGWAFAGYGELDRGAPGVARYSREQIDALVAAGFDVYTDGYRVFTRKPGDGVFEPGLTATENAATKV